VAFAVSPYPWVSQIQFQVSCLHTFHPQLGNFCARKANCMLVYFLLFGKDAADFRTFFAIHEFG